MSRDDRRLGRAVSHYARAVVAAIEALPSLLPSRTTVQAVAQLVFCVVDDIQKFGRPEDRRTAPRRPHVPDVVVTGSHGWPLVRAASFGDRHVDVVIAAAVHPFLHSAVSGLLLIVNTSIVDRRQRRSSCPRHAGARTGWRHDAMLCCRPLRHEV